MGEEGVKKGGAGVPQGIIAMWSGLLAAIPTGWALCDGADGRPDLRSKFIMGAPGGHEPGEQGGAATHGHDDHPALSHAGAAVADHASQSHAGAAVADHASQSHAGAAVANHASQGHAGSAVDMHPGQNCEMTTTGMFVGTGTTKQVPTVGHVHLLPTYSHNVTQPDAHAALSHSVTQPNAHATLSHSVTQPNAHAALSHSVTQPSDHAAQSHNSASNNPVYYTLAFIIKT